MRSLLLAFAVVASPMSAYAAEGGFWSSAAQATEHGDIIPSPDGRSRVKVARLDGGAARLETSGAIGVGRFDLPGIGAAEMLWSPDSQALVFTGSEGGANGLYDAYVIARENGRPTARNVSRLVRQAFGQPVKCGWREAPNVAAFGWRDGSATLLVAAQIINHSNCDSFGTFRAYQVDWRRMAITHSYDQLEAKRAFGPLLGAELRDAPDECVTTPRACWVATNHRGETP